MPVDAPRFTRALVRAVGDTFADGLTSADLGAPDLARARAQHAAYCAALHGCSVQVRQLPAEDGHPDGCFIEDTAVLLPEGAIVTRPGAATREGEIVAARTALAPDFPALACISAPGSMDGGDICEAGRVVFIGLSPRTNAEGAAQLAHWLLGLGYEPRLVEVHGIAHLLHLKSGLSWLGGRRLLLDAALAGHAAFADFDCIIVDDDERYAANAVLVNDRLLLPGGHPRIAARLSALGYDLLPLDMSEFRKMDGGLSCLSLRY